MPLIVVTKYPNPITILYSITIWYQYTLRYWKIDVEDKKKKHQVINEQVTEQLPQHLQL